MEQVKSRADGSPSSSVGLVPPRPSVVRDGWTPPPPLPTRPAPSDPAGSLDELTDQVEGVTGAMLASVDGFGLARSRSLGDEPSHAAMLAAAVGLAHQLATIGGGDRLRQLVVDHDAGLMLVWPIGSERVLAVLASSRVDQRALRTAVQIRVAALSGVSS